MNKELHETTNLGVEIMSSKRQVKGKIGHVVQIRVSPFDVNVMLNLSINDDQVTIHDVDILWFTYPGGAYITVKP